MPADVRRCADHGYFEGEACPACGAAGPQVLSGSRRRQLSKFVSGALRHFPDDAGIEVDESGWTPLESLADAVESKYAWAEREDVEGVVATDPKGRFERDKRDEILVVRAAYGHSVDVDLGATDTPVPDTLYHGMAPRNLDAIEDEGLQPMSRQQVHLSGTIAEAREVGARHADDPVVLEVDAAAMQADGLDSVKRGRSTYTTDHVPARVLTVLEA